MALDTLGNILFKQGMDRLPNSILPGWYGHWATVKQALACRETAVGIIVFIFAALAWLAFLSFTPLSIAAPLASANNIFILLASAWFLKERISRKRWLGVALIISGILFIGTAYQ